MATNPASRRCCKCCNQWLDTSTLPCPHPAVQRVYGGGGAIYMCVYCCRKCKYMERVGTGQRCTYEKDRE